jgi:MoaA/NifB/PqqE/SkfB family radical SAM enzyme
MAFNQVYPATANFAITYRCQCKCVHCSADPSVNPGRQELTTEELKTNVTAAQDLGASIVIYTGGEPLLHPDIFDLIRHVDKERSISMIFTNGDRLSPENCAKLAEAGLFSLNVSIDSVRPEVHDEARKVPGLYDKAWQGIKNTQAAGILAGVSTYASSESIANGDLEKLLKKAQAEGANEVTIFDCIPSGKFLKRTDLILSPDEKKRIIELAKKYHEMDHPMGVIAMAHVNSPEGVGCFGARTQFYVTAYGDVDPCDFNPISFGNVREMPLDAIWYKMTAHPDFSIHHKTCRMQTPEYRARYIDVLPDEIKFPIYIEDVERYRAEKEKAEAGAAVE